MIVIPFSTGGTQILFELLELIGISKELALELIAIYGEKEVQQRYNAMLWVEQYHRITNKPGWLIRSLQQQWKLPDMPKDWSPHVIQFRLDHETFLEILLQTQEERKMTDSNVRETKQPRWTTSRKLVSGCKQCGAQIRQGEKIFFDPQAKAAYCTQCGKEIEKKHAQEQQP